MLVYIIRYFRLIWSLKFFLVISKNDFIKTIIVIKKLIIGICKQIYKIYFNKKVKGASKKDRTKFEILCGGWIMKFG